MLSQLILKGSFFFFLVLCGLQFDCECFKSDICFLKCTSAAVSLICPLVYWLAIFKVLLPGAVCPRCLIWSQMYKCNYDVLKCFSSSAAQLCLVMKQNYLFLYTRSYFNPLNRTLSWKMLNFYERSATIFYYFKVHKTCMFFQRNQVHASRGHAIQSYSCAFYNWESMFASVICSVWNVVLFLNVYVGSIWTHLCKLWALLHGHRHSTHMLCMVYSTHLLGTAVEKDSIASLSPQIFPSLPIFTGCLHHTASLHWQ